MADPKAAERSITCIHGFLGHPHDWDFLRNAGLKIETIDPGAASVLADTAVDHGGEVLLGYSMGGRLALQAITNGARYDRAVIVSAGLNLEEGRTERADRDLAWARRFESERWDEVVRDWNAQPIFGGHVMERAEEDFDRVELSRALREFSPGVLPPLERLLPTIEIPVLWIAGAQDSTYVAIAERAATRIPSCEVWIAPEAGHRVPWEQPAAFAERVRRFVAY